MADFGILQPVPSFAQAALGAHQAGMQAGREKRTQAALGLYARDPEAGVAAISAVDPVLGIKLDEVARERRKREAYSAVFSVPQTASAPIGNAATNAAAHPDVPASNGLTINQDALRELAQLDPEAAFGITKFQAQASKEQAEQVKAHLTQKANAADYLLSVPQGPARVEAFNSLKPTLMQQGFTEAELGTADLSDAMLRRDRAIGMTFEQRLNEADKAADNARADRADARSAARDARSEALAYRADRRSEVRFNEREKDRAALAGAVTLGDKQYVQKNGQWFEVE